ncbi:MAG: quinone-dependent dihydroorotate dehydrogenase [Deltaproteobacteria bacterium]|nr:quinone-dependent dihydroorotate dehydrogenase [Deltaproteobacteria bacterium]
MMTFFHRLLLMLDAEVAHTLVITLLKGYQWLLFNILRRRMPSLNKGCSLPVFSKLNFRNRLGLAAGFDKGAEVFAALAQLGFGFIEVGTVTPKPQIGNPKPRLWRHPPDALINHMGFNNCGLPRFKKNIEKYRRFVPGVPLFANIGKNFNTSLTEAIKDYQALLQSLRPYVDAFVINLSSPNTPGLQSLQSTTFLDQIAAVAPTDLPILIKLSPDLDNKTLLELYAQVNATKKFNGVVVVNTSARLAQSLYQAPQGGLSGRPLFERALECVALARGVLKYPKIIVGVGGVSSAEDVLKMRKAGADLVEIYTALIYRGPQILRELSSVLERLPS